LDVDRGGAVVSGITRVSVPAKAQPTVLPKREKTPLRGGKE